MDGIVAVNDFTGKGVLQNEADLITDEIRSALLTQGKISVVERDVMTQRLRNRPGAAGYQCDEADCIVEVGRLLGVPHVILGSIGKLGKLYIVNAKIVDASTGQVLSVVTERGEGSIEDVLTMIPQKIAITLAKELRTWYASDLKISTKPSGASIELDGKSLGVTPIPSFSLTLGTHRLIAELADHKTFATSIDVVRGKSNDLNFELEPVPALLREKACLATLAGANDTIKLDRSQIQSMTADFTALKKSFVDSSASLKEQREWRSRYEQRRTTALRLAGGGVALGLIGIGFDRWAESQHSSAYSNQSTSSHSKAQTYNTIGDIAVVGGLGLLSFAFWQVAF